MFCSYLKKTEHTQASGCQPKFTITAGKSQLTSSADPTRLTVEFVDRPVQPAPQAGQTLFVRPVVQVPLCQVLQVDPTLQVPRGLRRLDWGLSICLCCQIVYSARPA